MKELLWEEDSRYLVYQIDYNDKIEILTALGQKLCETGYVKQSYIKAVCEREIVFPTGLPTEGIGIAIPHADSMHVNEKAMIVGILKEPAKFQVMGSLDEFVDVELIFMLAIKEPQSQLEMLQKLIEMCQNKEKLCALRNYTSLEQVREILSELM